MREIAVSKHGKTLFCLSLDDEHKLSEYHDNQILRCKIYGVRKQRSYQQLKMFWSCCRTVADNTDNQFWNTPQKVAFQIKVGLHFVDPSVTSVRPDGGVQFLYRSISFKNLSHMDACGFFDRAFDLMANKLGCKVDELLENSE